ncbi:hypothetical protein NY035_02795 [Corynebacterium diphtheriae bv. mitis]|uniref:hypothetical protein n=1 Tax=Corynebacterium diphtheriae TaxID=1717 RepID=UPI001071AA27|nr:hypothetical protein [Corynebacterium diphtheriae]MBG9362430.1 hypothetical protein [Corynebacterium diphtheriae bv. mitis]UJL62156.1 hypothetical protein FE375_03115 [Corynebacterium diphtheriae]UWE92756.1 hypothetical protein NY044_04085 [Corynebacterium diphtheriae bv. mitis]UWF22620.1 hypothetical protein NY035_02795 [Corynebacterium diphtheriae bv. mitis]UWF27026.1 hypothetical protein NY036_02795 [Corynebacterium diphtheriae bv. mitis]
MQNSRFLTGKLSPWLALVALFHLFMRTGLGVWAEKHWQFIKLPKVFCAFLTMDLRLWEGIVDSFLNTCNNQGRECYQT